MGLSRVLRDSPLFVYSSFVEGTPYKGSPAKEKAIAIALEFKKIVLPVVDIAKRTGRSIEEPRRALRSKIEKL